MGGASLQLSLYGNQDILLTGAPQVTYFKLIYRRHTLFSMESGEQVFQSTADFGRRTQCPITRSGDLVSDVWLQVTLPNLEDFRYDTAQTPTATVPGIASARWTSSTTARVKINAPTAAITPVPNASVRYRVTLDPPTENATEFFYSSGTTPVVELTGLDSTQQYTVTVRREQEVNDVVDAGTASAESDPEDIVSIRWTNSIGHALLRSAEVEIGGVRIDRHESDYLDILSELTTPEEKRTGFESMIGKYPSYDLYDNSFQESRTLFIPLKFFFNRSPGLSLPLVSLAYHNCVLNFEFRNYTELVRSTVPITTLTHITTGTQPSMECRLYCNFILLDTEERRRFASSPMEYLIEQCQFLGDKPIIIDNANPNLNVKAEMNFSHPVKELMWVYNFSTTYNSNINAMEYSTLGNDYFNYNLPNSTEDPILDAKIMLNGHDRTVSRPAQYYRLVQPYQHHTRIPSKKIYTFSFALHPEDMQPSGTCNFSRTDTAHLVLNMNPSLLNTKGRLRIFANSYNVFRVASGLGGLAFAGS